jgi:hypothetical protein
MTVTYGFYDSLAGDRKYNADQMSRIFQGIITDGVFATVGGGLIVTESPFTMNINVLSGRAWFNNTWTYNDATLVLTVDASEPVLNRIDTVVVEVDSSTSVRANSIKIVKGTPASTPVSPTLANTSTLHQYGLADIYIAAGVTAINSANITNRVGTTNTPFITGALSTIDAETLFAQWDAIFTYWFETFVDELTTEQATNLQAQIIQLQSGWVPINGTCSYVSADSPIFVMNVPDADAALIDAGCRIWLTQTTPKYFIVNLKGTPSGGNTPLYLHGGTDYTLVNAAITNPYFSRVKEPNGFPFVPSKWSYSTTNVSKTEKTIPTQNNWYGGSNLSPAGPSISVPIGCWYVSMKGLLEIVTPATLGGFGVLGTFSADPLAETLAASTTQFINGQTANALTHRQMYYIPSPFVPITVSIKTTYYFDIRTSQASVSSISIRGDISPSVITLLNAYL